MRMREDGLFRFLNELNDGVSVGISEHFQTTYYRLGDKVLAINYYDGLKSYFEKTLSHLEYSSEPASEVALTIDCFVVNEHYTFPFKKEDYLMHGILDGYNDDEHFAMFNHGVNAYSFYDIKTKRASYLVRDPANMPFWELCAPFKNIIHWWTADTDYQLIHGAFLSIDGTGLLLTGKGGSGKSTTTVGAVLEGHKTLGEDYLLANVKEAKAYSLYGTAKLDQYGIERFPELESYIDSNLLHTEERKAFFYLNEVRPGTLALSGTIDFHLLPTISHSSTTSMHERASAEGIKRLAPSTIFQLPRLRELTFKKCSSLCRKIPTYEVLLGKSTEEICQSISHFTKGVAAS